MSQKCQSTNKRRRKKEEVKEVRIFAGDFETTVFEGQTYTEVWSSAFAELWQDEVTVHNNINDTMEYFLSLGDNCIIYYHNLKFDGEFILNWLLRQSGYKQAIYYLDPNQDDVADNIRFLKPTKMKNNTFRYTISDRGQWYNIIIKHNGKTIEFRDSLKLLPFSLRKIGKDFQTQHQKTEMEYTGFRYAGCPISADELTYIKNDVLVLKEALEIFIGEGHTKSTIGSCCMQEFKNGYDKEEYKTTYPNLYELMIDKRKHGVMTAGDFIRRSYHGGWCYVVKGKENKVFKNGVTLDVNSLYPSVMHSESGSYYPIGKPKFWTGNEIPKEALLPRRFFFIRFKCMFHVKQGYLPFVQIKGNLLYDGTECLETSMIYDKDTDRYYDKYYDRNGVLQSATVTLTMTQTDYYLFLEHYDVEKFEILDGCWFYAEKGIFDKYINKYREIKMNSEGAKRSLAKLFLNNLYGKMASSEESSFKYAYLKGDGSLGFIRVRAYEKEAGYIAIGSAITSYARNFTIRHAQKNYYGKDKAGFIYADTDSLHIDLPIDKIKGVKLHDTAFNAWKCEKEWNFAIFARQKTYIEHDKDGYDIKCAGMPTRSKELLTMSFNGTQTFNDCKDDAETDFLFDEDGKPIIRSITDFKVGLRVPSKLVPKHITGGVLLVNTEYTMR